MEFSHLNYDVVDSIAEISLQRPPVNALNLEMIREIVDAVNRAAEDPTVRAVIFASNVPRRFCISISMTRSTSLVSRRSPLSMARRVAAG